MFYYEEKKKRDFPEENVMKCLFYFQDDSGRSYSDLSVQFVSESSRQTVVHLQAASSVSRGNLAVPARPVATPRPAVPARATRPARVPAAPSVNLDWRIFGGVEESFCFLSLVTVRSL